MMNTGFSEYPDGWFLVDKEPGWTSFDVVNRLRRSLRVKKMGHAGTLDPAATGLLILASGKNTRLIQSVQDLPKRYTGTIRLGYVTASFDQETEPVYVADPGRITDAEIGAAIAENLTGTIWQTPPMYSAIKVGGKKLYELARKGKTAEVSAREVTVYAFEWNRRLPDELDFTIHCSKGTYIRSLANDLGRLLAVGGYLVSLRRISIGDWSVNDALTVQETIRQFSSLIPEQHHG